MCRISATKNMWIANSCSPGHRNSKTRSEVMQICDIFRAKIIDVQPETLAIEVTGTDSKMTKFLGLMERFGSKNSLTGAPAHENLGFADTLPLWPLKFTPTKTLISPFQGRTLAVLLGFLGRRDMPMPST